MLIILLGKKKQVRLVVLTPGDAWPEVNQNIGMGIAVLLLINVAIILLQSPAYFCLPLLLITLESNKLEAEC